MVPKCISDGLQDLVAHPVPALVVHGLESVNIDVGGHQGSALSTGASHLVSELLQPHPPPSHTGQLVGAGVPAVIGGLLAISRPMLTVACCVLAIARRVLAVTRRVRAVACRPGAAGTATAAQLFYSQGVPIEAIVLGVEGRGRFVATVSDPGAQLRDFVASQRGDVARPSRAIA